MNALYDPRDGPMRIVGFMSGKGSNLRAIIDHERWLEREGGSPYHVAAIFTDRASNAQAIGAAYDLPVITRDLNAFHAKRNKPKRDLETRAEYDAQTVETLAPYEADAIALAGYLSIVTEPLIDAYLGVNVHPADLSIRSGTERRYTGLDVVRRAIEDGVDVLRSSTHLVDRGVDSGRILMISKPVPVLDRSIEAHEQMLKREERSIFPRTLEWIAAGRFAQDEKGTIHADGIPAPNGHVMD